MIVTFVHPTDALVLARARRDRLHAEAAAETLRGPSPARRALAAALRRAADRVEPVRPATPQLRLNRERYEGQT